MKAVNKYLFFFYFITNSLFAFSQQTTFSSGSFIVNMGVTPQTVSNGLKPYGMVYDLVRNYDVPVYWVINPNKLKDGIDFIYNGTSYKGGPFIIAAENRNATVDSRIAYWISQGVVGVNTTSSLTATVAQKITAVPRWTLDTKTGQIAQTYITNAGIPIGNTNWTDPTMLNNCNDIFVLPHADPKWNTHQSLINWNNTNRGSIWASCHAVSVLENMFNPLNPSQQANFLALNSGGPGSNALVPFGSHKDGSVPYNNNSYASDQVMQFMGPIDNATDNGSESIYLPALGGGWRPTTKVGVYDPSQEDIPGLSSGKAALIVYGRGYGDNNRGWVMYEAGHDLFDGGEQSIAAQRAFLNFSFMATMEKSMNLAVTGIQNVMISNQVYSLTGTVSQSVPTGPYTAQWTSSCGGIFSNPTSLTTNYTAPLVGMPSNCVLSLKVTDACGRSRFYTQTISVTSGPRPPAVNADALSFSPDCINLNPEITINALANDIEPDGQPMTISSVSGTDGTWTINPDQTIKFIPNPGFYGSTTANYTVCDNTSPTPICNSSTIIITIGNINQQPLPVNDTYTILEDSIQRLTVLANDGVGNAGGSLKIAGISVNPLYGKVSINPDNTITYIPTADNRIVDSFYYRVVNGGGYTATAKVIINITADGCSAGSYQTCVPGPNPISIISSEDTYMRYKFPTINYGTESVISYDREGGDKQRALVKFSLPSLTCSPGNPPTIISAQIKLQKFSSGNNSESGEIYQVLENWNESQVTWNDRITGVPWSLAGGVIPASPEASQTVSSDGIYTWDITSLVTRWYGNPGSNPNYGVMVKTVEGGGDRQHDYASRENTTSGVLKPTLVIAYSIPTLCSLIPTRPPLAMPDTARTNSLTAVTFNVINNDYFSNAGTKTVSLIPGSVSSGSATIISNDITYTPLNSFSGTASLQYRVLNNTTGLADTANAYIFVSYAAPIANNDSSSIFSGESITLNVTLNDIDPQNIGINATVISGPTYGTQTASGNNITYNAPYNFIGRDTITYRLTNAVSGLCNEQNASDTAYFIIIVNNRAPLAVNDNTTTNPCQAITIDVLKNDTDPENGNLTISSVSATTPVDAGTVTTNGAYVYYTPNPLYIGSSATFTYTVTDDAIPALISNAATVTVNLINSINLAPVALNDTIMGLYECNNYIAVLNNDSDPENDNLTVSLPLGILKPLHGTISVLANGLVVYTPVPGYSGYDVFEYKIEDSHLGPSGGSCVLVSQSAIAKVYITIANNFSVLKNTDLKLAGVRIDQTNNLNWNFNEPNGKVDYYLERSSDNKNYISIAQIRSRNNLAGNEVYNFTDNNSTGLGSFYRIKVISENQATLYSNTVFIKNEIQENSLQVFPVPFNKELNVQFNAPVSENITVEITGHDGRKIKSLKTFIKKGFNTIQLKDLESIAPGSYIVRIYLSGSVMIKQVLKLEKF